VTVLPLPVLAPLPAIVLRLPLALLREVVWMLVGEVLLALLVASPPLNRPQARRQASVTRRHRADGVLGPSLDRARGRATLASIKDLERA